MTSFKLRTAAASAGAVLLLTLTACSGGGGQNQGGTSADDLPKGPLDEMFEEMYGSEDTSRMDQQMVEVEEITAACMAEQGFEYTPVDWSQQGGMMPADEPEEEWGTLEFAKKWGYGATTNPYGDPTESTGEEPEFVDPNQAVVEAMSETERTAYYEALYGPPQEGDGEEMTEYNWETAGCSGKAQHEVYEVGTGMDEEAFTALQEEMDTMWQSIQDDPRLAELNEKWASCMADAGYDGLAEPADAEALIYDKTNAIYEEAYAEENFDESSTEEDWAAIEEGIQEQLAAITEEEIETAVADYTCREDVDLIRTQAEINVEYQQEFYDAHEAELEAWREAIAAQG